MIWRQKFIRKLNVNTKRRFKSNLIAVSAGVLTGLCVYLISDSDDASTAYERYQQIKNRLGITFGVVSPEDYLSKNECISSNAEEQAKPIPIIQREDPLQQSEKLKNGENHGSSPFNSLVDFCIYVYENPQVKLVGGLVVGVIGCFIGYKLNAGSVVSAWLSSETSSFPIDTEIVNIEDIEDQSIQPSLNNDSGSSTNLVNERQRDQNDEVNVTASASSSPQLSDPNRQPRPYNDVKREFMALNRELSALRRQEIERISRESLIHNIIVD